MIKEDLEKLKQMVHGMMGACKEANIKINIDRRMIVPDDILKELANDRTVIINQYMGDININIMQIASDMLLQIDKMLVTAQKPLKDLSLESLEPVGLRLYQNGVGIKEIISDLKQKFATIATKNTRTKTEAAKLAGVTRGAMRHILEQGEGENE